MHGAKEYRDIGEMKRAIEKGELVYVPDKSDLLGVDITNDVGELAHNSTGDPNLLAASREYYRTLNPAAAGALLYIAEQIRRETHQDYIVRVKSMTRNKVYQRALEGKNSQANEELSNHDTGYCFDAAKPGPAGQYVLENLRDRGLISVRYEGNGCADITVNPKFAHLFANYFHRVADQVK
jgi:hypothetical protein